MVVTSAQVVAVYSESDMRDWRMVGVLQKINSVIIPIEIGCCILSAMLLEA